MKISVICVAVLALAVTITPAFSQMSRNPSITEIGVDLIVPVDESAPIEILSPSFKTNEKGYKRLEFAIRNRSAKLVSRIVLEEISWLGERQASSTLTPKLGEYFLPGEKLSNFSVDDVETRSSDLARSERSSNGPKDLVIFFVTEVDFADGTYYRSPVDAKTVSDFCTRLSIRSSMADDELRDREDSLRQFLEDSFGRPVGAPVGRKIEDTQP